jgi:hypothetical protein
MFFTYQVNTFKPNQLSYRSQSRWEDLTSKAFNYRGLNSMRLPISPHLLIKYKIKRIGFEPMNANTKE